MTDTFRRPDHGADRAGVHRAVPAAPGGIRGVRAEEIWSRAGSLLSSGLRLALMSVHHDARSADVGRSLRVVYLFTGGPPGGCTELHVRVPLDRPRIPTLAGMSPTASAFEADLARRHGIIFADPLLINPVTTEPNPATDPCRLRHRMRYRSGNSPSRDPLALARRITRSTDTPVGHALAFCLAVENAAGHRVTPHAARARAILLELERLHHHITDLAMVLELAGNHAHHACALQLREQLLRLNHQVAGHRLLRGGILLGGADLHRSIDDAEIYALIRRFTDFADSTLGDLRLRARLNGAGVLPTARARDLGVLGFIARASGVDNDARRTHPFVDLDLEPVAVSNQGDALARFWMRVHDLRASAVLIAELSRTTPAGRSTAPPAAGRQSGAVRGVGIVEGWRGAIVCRVELDPHAAIAAVSIVDPSLLHTAVIHALRDHMGGSDPALVDRSLHTLTDGPPL